MFKKIYRLILDFANRIVDKMSNTYSYIYSRLFNKLLIHIIGDSHVLVFKNKRLFIAHHIGPATMHNLNKETSSTQSNEKLFDVINKIDTKRDVVMLVFGEIDCRIHIYYQYEKQNKKLTIAELIDRTISNYGYILEKIKLMGIRFCVYGIPALGTQENYYNYPFYGTPQMRSKIYKEFNNRLKIFCRENNYIYIDIYPKVSDNNGFILKEYMADEVHLNERIINFVRQELNKEFGK